MAAAAQAIQLPATLYTAAPPPGVELSLHIFDGQYMVQYRDRSGALVSKFVSAESVRQAVLDEHIDTGYLPYGVVRWGTGVGGAWAVRYEPPAKRRIYLDVTGAASEAITVPLPAFIFVGQGNRYSLFAVTGAQFNPLSTLYRAPLPNVADDGDICFGKNSVPAVADGGMERAFDLFWAAPFNDHHMENRSKQHADDIRVQLRALAAGGAAKYPARDLVKCDLTVDDFVRRLTSQH
jgi:PRTRC genetic system protein B